MTDQGLAERIYQTIKSSMAHIFSLQKVPQGSFLDESARNAAQAVVCMLDIEEMERACPVCGSCPICGKREEHEH